ncbi:hypothetical protein D5E87_02950 [Vibrio parahaemolyticus]|uniref:hypothetical protein n=1 Tax=Vibrio parahaemolyticus TaxID=670 RepID=UPI001036F6C4|nr:hypothetical protein [Vibrio parahaemolyticus]ELA8153074.1 hypothetical protein [Vibrio parahaemolyticus]TBT08415.1 hypothetical protein D5E87_02950 [Vibrio parahaemolyticus]TOK04765.1 hypothetical protein CGI25_21980 [Vibrio parahaemolyticus]
MYDEFRKLRDEKAEGVKNATIACGATVKKLCEYMNAVFGKDDNCEVRLGNDSGRPMGKAVESSEHIPFKIGGSVDEYRNNIVIEAFGSIVLLLDSKPYPVLINARIYVYGDDAVTIEVPTELHEDGRIAEPVSIKYKEGDDDEIFKPIADAVIRELIHQIKLK